MTTVNLPPPVSDSEIVKTLAFPYQKGPLNFPALAKPENSVYNAITALINTSKGERVMDYDYGTNLYEFVFTNMTPIDKMRLSSAITNAVETYIPNVIVDRVSVGQMEYDDGIGTMIFIGVDYRVAGQQYSQQIEFSPNGQGV